MAHSDIQSHMHRIGPQQTAGEITQLKFRAHLLAPMSLLADKQWLTTHGTNIQSIHQLLMGNRSTADSDEPWIQRQ